MKLIDRSPGGFYALANAALFAVVLAEVLMLRSGSVVALVAMLAVIVVIAALLVRWMMQLMGPEDHALDYEPQRASAPPKPRTSPARAPRRARVGAHRPVAH
jgi:hypothetical protein